MGNTSHTNKLVYTVTILCCLLLINLEFRILPRFFLCSIKRSCVDLEINYRLVLLQMPHDRRIETYIIDICRTFALDVSTLDSQLTCATISPAICIITHTLDRGSGAWILSGIVNKSSPLACVNYLNEPCELIFSWFISI